MPVGLDFGACPTAASAVVLVAPTLEAAGAVAEEGAAYTAELCDSFSAGVWITVERTPGGDGIREHYSVFKRLMIGGHRL